MLHMTVARSAFRPKGLVVGEAEFEGDCCFAAARITLAALRSLLCVGAQ
jgi:hypothetical protein